MNIIGAGISGLSAAFFLARKGHEVQVFESAPETGGLAGFFSVGESYLEKYYHHFFTGHTNLIELMKELNIDDQFIFRDTKTGFYFDNRIYPFVTTKDLLKFNPLKFRNRIRVGLTSLMMMCINDWRALEKKSALEWLRRYSGDEACRIIWEPLLRMKFGDDYHRISAAWLWNRVVDRKRSGPGKDVLGYIKGGYKTLFDSLVRNIESRGGEIKTGVPVEKIHAKNGRVFGVSSNGEFFSGDIVLSTVSIPSFLQMASFLPKDYVNALMSVKYQGSICVVLKLKQALSEYYWINISDPNCPFVGIIEHTNFVSPQHYGNSHLIYLTKYASSNDPIFLKLDEDIFGNFLAYLIRIFPKFSENDIDKYWVFKDRFSQPVFVQNYSKIMPDISTPIGNLYMLNTSQIYPQSRSINSGIESARNLVKEILS